MSVIQGDRRTFYQLLVSTLLVLVANLAVTVRTAATPMPRKRRAQRSCLSATFD
ncbi:hypothetical protein EV385_0472 [Krasilnikovia cinnamomea]|uniref:Uncharacterized protein n=1 Tax=Krasilnikovia cinnamomea TaxID=349313 RepID=A0A4Q7ZDM3_9ACTN|nr:hypothetical protein EV385_0472 [Krasilnikovia cinnamomea]